MDIFYVSLAYVTIN